MGPDEQQAVPVPQRHSDHHLQAHLQQTISIGIIISLNHIHA